MSITTLIYNYLNNYIVSENLRTKLTFWSDQHHKNISPTEISDNKIWIWSNATLYSLEKKIKLESQNNIHYEMSPLLENNNNKNNENKNNNELKMINETNLLKDRFYLNNQVKLIDEENTVTLITRSSLRPFFYFILTFTLIWNAQFNNGVAIIAFLVQLFVVLYICYLQKTLDKETLLANKGWAANHFLQVPVQNDPHRYTAALSTIIISFIFLHCLSLFSLGIYLIETPTDHYHYFETIYYNSTTNLPDHVVYYDVNDKYYYWNATSEISTMHNCGNDMDCLPWFYCILILSSTIGFTSTICFTAWMLWSGVATPELQVSVLSRLQSIISNYPKSLPFIISLERKAFTAFDDIKKKNILKNRYFLRSTYWVLNIFVTLLLIELLIYWDTDLFKGYRSNNPNDYGERSICGICIWVFLLWTSTLYIIFVCYIKIGKSLFYGYKTCDSRLKALSRELFRINAADFERLSAWWEIRQFNLQCILPAYYKISTYGIAGLIIMTGVWTIEFILNYVVNLFIYNLNLVDTFLNTWPTFAWVALLTFGFLISFNVMKDIIIEQNEQKNIIERKLIEINLMKNTGFDIKQSGYILEDNEFISKSNQSVSKDYFINPLLLDIEDQQKNKQYDESEQLLEYINSYMEKFDPKPTILGFEITLKFIHYVYLSLAAAVVFTALSWTLGTDAFNLVSDFAL